MSLFFVDCEAWGNTPRDGQLTEFGAVAYPSRATFHGVLVEAKPSKENPAIPEPGERPSGARILDVFSEFDKWITTHSKGRPIMVSDNPAFDFMWIADGFWQSLGRNPFGHSARRISDFYAGLVGNFYETQAWKRLRVTEHDHNPVNDAMGNLEAFERLIGGER